MKLLAPLLAVAIYVGLPAEARAQFCTAVCFDLVDDSGDVYGHGCTNEENGDLRCDATAHGCAITECDDNPVVALAPDGSPVALIGACGDDSVLRRDLIRDPLRPGEVVAWLEERPSAES